MISGVLAVALEFNRYAGKGAVRNRLTACPLCGHNFERHEPRWKHFLNEHDPEDAGLSPLGQTPPEASRPLFADDVAASGGEYRAD